MNFNLDDLLLKNSDNNHTEINFLNLINKEVDKNIKDKLSISNSVKKLTGLINSKILIEVKEIENILNELRQFYLALESKSSNFSDRESKELKSNIRLELINLEKKIQGKDEDITILKNKGTSLKNNNEDLKNKIEDLGKVESDLKHQLEDLKITNEEENNNYNNLKEKIENIKEEIKNLKKSNRLKKQKYEEIVQEEYSLKNQINKENLKNEDLKNEISDKSKKLIWSKKK